MDKTTAAKNCGHGPNWRLPANMSRCLRCRFQRTKQQSTSCALGEWGEENIAFGSLTLSYTLQAPAGGGGTAVGLCRPRRSRFCPVTLAGIADEVETDDATHRLPGNARHLARHVANPGDQRNRANVSKVVADRIVKKVYRAARFGLQPKSDERFYK